MAYLRASPSSGWIFERDDVSVFTPGAGGVCQGGQDVHRLFSDTRTASGVGYRHTGDPWIRASLLAQGWIDEGVAFCAVNYRSPGT